MKRIIYISLALFIASCAPGKNGEVVTVDIYCDSCQIEILNGWRNGQDNGSEIAFSGLVDDYKSIQVNRFNRNSCVRISGFTNYSNDSLDVYFIEGNDTIGYENYQPIGFCF